MTLQEIITNFDTIERKGFDEYDVSTALRVLVPDNRDEICDELRSELMAFDFMEDYKDQDTGWGTYFGPMMVWNNGDGTATESPSIKLITPEMIDYWEKRAKESSNPILISRYSGLVWDFQNKITGTNPSHEICRIYIRGLIAIANGNFLKHAVYTYAKLKRALVLSIAINDDALIENCKEAIINFEKNNSQDTKAGLWGYSFDLLIGNKKIKLSTIEEADIIKELENKLDRLTTEDEEHKIDPWVAEAAAERLAIYYKKSNKNDEIKRVLLKVGNGYDKIIDEASAMQASGWLDHLYKIYKKFNLNDEAEETLLKLRKLGPQVASDMGSFPFSFDIPQKEMDEYINEMTSGSIETILMRITIRFIPLRNEAKEQIFDLSKKAPMTFLISQQLQDEKGRVIAIIGALKDDLEGHIIRHISQSLLFSSLFLRLIFQETINKLGLNKNEILNFIKRTPIIQEERFAIIERGIEAYFSNDYIVAIHLMIPQIEEAVRTIVETSGGNILKTSRSGGYNLRTFDDILRDDVIIKVLGEDFANYLRILFTDPRGWNMRNNVCHGIANPNMFNSQTADRVLHALLCLRLVQKKK